MQTLDEENLNDRNQDVYRDFRRLVFKNFRDIKKVSDYEIELGISVKQLSEICNKRSGKSPLSIIYKQFILEAKRLLNNNLSAKEVAYNLKFEDPAHFSKFFKKLTDQSPSQFQKIQA